MPCKDKQNILNSFPVTSDGKTEHNYGINHQGKEFIFEVGKRRTFEQNHTDNFDKICHRIQLIKNCAHNGIFSTDVRVRPSKKSS